MKRSLALVLSAAATAVLLVLCAGVVLAIQYVSGLPGPDAQAQAKAQATGTAEAAALATSDASAEQATRDVIDQYQKREAAFRKSIEEANTRIAKANADNKLLAKQLGDARQALATATSELTSVRQQPAQAQGYPVTPEMAANLALSLAQGASISRDPELVTYQEHIAYKVSMDAGFVIVDANTNAVLYAGRRDPEG